MLCMQQCIDLCELSAEQALTVRDHFDLQDILAIQGSCLGTVRDPLGLSECLLLGLQNELLKEINSADSFDDLAVALNHYQALVEYRERASLSR
ncbi:MAG: hypothetical protein D4R84_01460 [Rhodocyclaceae bacterium]|nr:MAG: hypothetical protein D4R84_01460 [Rhodocyclaceae bacterium]